MTAEDDMQNMERQQRMQANPPMLSDSTANMLIAAIFIMFLIGLYLVPNGKDGEEKSKDFAASKKKVQEDKNSKFAVPKEGGVL